MTSKQEELKQRLAAVLHDLSEAGEADPEAVWLIGSLAATLIDKTASASWTGLKSAMTQDTYTGLVKDFQEQGNALWQAGKPKHTYAIQALAVSIVASTQRSDPDMRNGEALLDEVIESAVRVFRTSQQTH